MSEVRSARYELPEVQLPVTSSISAEKKRAMSPLSPCQLLLQFEKSY
jgi:hypothetical protein